MYTLTRKLSVVCLTVVLSFLVYGCGGSSKQALITEVTNMVTGNLMPDPGTYTIEPGGTANAGDVSFTCPEGGPSCEVTVADDGTIVMSTSAEGMVIAMNSDLAIAKAERDAAVKESDAANKDKVAAEAARDDAIKERDDALEAQRIAEIRNNPNPPTDLDDLDSDIYGPLPSGEFFISDGDTMDIGGLTFTCSGGDCYGDIDDDGNVESAEGMVTAQYSMAAKTTIIAIALGGDNALGMQEPASTTSPLTGAPATVGVSRSPSGDTTIKLTHVTAIPRTIRTRLNMNLRRLTQVTKLPDPDGWVRH